MSNQQTPRTPNDQRSDAKNPTSPEHQDGLDNRSRQLNPEDQMNQPPTAQPPEPGKT
jgi:hypothetical protein